MTIGDKLTIPVTVKNLNNEDLTFSLTSETSDSLSAPVPQTLVAMTVKKGRTETVDIILSANALSDGAYVYIIANA